MKKLFAFLVMAVVLCALSASAGSVYWEGFNYYSNGYGVINQSGGKWLPWQGPNNSKDNSVTNAPARFANTLRLTQLDGAGGFSEVWSMFPQDAFQYCPQVSVTFSFFVPAATLSDNFSLYFCSGDIATTNSSYGSSGPGGISINGVTPGAATASVVYDNEYLAGGALVGNVSKEAWHDLRMDLTKPLVGTTGSIFFTLDGRPIGSTIFPLQNVNNTITGLFNVLDFYANGNDIMYIDNIIVEDRPVDLVATNFYVAVTGNDANDGLTAATAWRNLSHALDKLCYLGAQMNPGAVVSSTVAQPVPTNNWIAINVGTGLYIDVANCPSIDVPPRDVYRLGYDTNVPAVNAEVMCHNFLLIRGAGIGKTTFVQTFVNEFKFKVYARFFRLEDCTVQGLSDASIGFFNNIIQMRPVNGMGIDYRVERVQVCHAASEPGTLTGQRTGLGFFENWQRLRNKVARGCLFNNVGAGLLNYNNLNQYPMLAENCTFADLPGDYGGRGNGIICEGAGGIVKNCLFVNIGTNATAADRGHAVSAWPILTANLNTAFSDIILIDNNMVNIGLGGANYIEQQVGAAYIRNLDQQTFAPVVLQTLDDMPYRAGLGNIGYKAARGGTYYIDQKSPVLRDGGAIGSSWATAYRSVSVPVSLLNQAPPLSDATYPVTFNIRGFFTNQFTASNGNPIVGRGLQYAGDYVSFIGDNPTNTMLYKSSAFRNETGSDGRNLTIYPASKQSCTIRNMSLVAEYWFPPGAAGGYSLGAFRNWDTKSYLSNVYVHALHCDTNTMVVSDDEAQVTAAISISGAPRLEAEDSCFDGGYNGFRANDNTLTQKFTRCTFRGTYRATGDALGGYGILLVGGGRNVMVDKCILGASDKGAVYVGSTAVVMGDDNIVYGNGTTGVVLEAGAIDLLTNSKTFDPLLGTYDGHKYGSPYRTTGYGWAYRPLGLANSSWPMAGRNKQRQGWYTNGAPLTVAGILWTNASAAAAGSMWDCGLKLGSTATDGERVFAALNPVAANSQATLLALDPSTGTTIWNGVLGGAGRYGYGTPAVGETMVYIAEVSDGANQRVYGVDRVTGIPVWSNQIDNMMGAAILLHNGKLYFDTDWNVSGLWCLDAMSGTVLWSNRFTAGEWGSSGTSVSPDGNAVYNHGDDGMLHAINANNGATLWTAGPYEEGQGNNEPVVDNAGNVYCMFPGVTNGDPSAVLYKYAPDGSNLWSFRFDNETDDGGMAFSPNGNTLYATISSTSTNAGLFAFDPVTGVEKWRVYAGKCGGSPVVAAPGNIIIGVFFDAGGIWARAIQDNGTSATIIWSISLGAPHTGWLSVSAMMRPAIMANGDVIVQNPAGRIACITVPEPGAVLGVVLAALALLRRKR